MDEKMMQILSRLIEGQNETNKQLSEMTGRFGGLESKVGGLESKLEGLESKVGELGSKLEGLESKVGGLESKLEGLESKVGELGSKLEGLESKVGELESKVDRTTLFMEETQTNIKVIGEGIVAFREQVDRQFEHVHSMLSEKTNFLETVIKAHSLEVNKLKDESKHIQGIIGEHEVSIRILKASNS